MNAPVPVCYDKHATSADIQDLAPTLRLLFDALVSLTEAESGQAQVEKPPPSAIIDNLKAVPEHPPRREPSYPADPFLPSSRPLHAFASNPVNTAKLSSPILLQRTVSYDAGTKPPRRGSIYLNMPDRNTAGARRRRSSSILQVYHEPPETLEQISDQASLPNLNANWTNAKGAWTIHIVLIACCKIIYDALPGVSQETSWTLTNMTYMFGSYIMFHHVRGVPFDFNSGAFDNLNMWEQIDNGAQYTPTKKFLLGVPIALFLVSTHYTHYDLTYFIINLLAVLGVVIPKLPFSHRMRFGLFSGVPED
ncbi:hypothetical protein CDV36_007107 [Fusarium kuroshium]|uniref:Protein ORM1 n=1 Tax=Fusarium kuroshium TaxID=2010991 RepID=A0A3M2S6P1_9HYPO|nr:hypothetical protein CDV36_007107 [Fusarium kuroshium]